MRRPTERPPAAQPAPFSAPIAPIAAAATNNVPPVEHPAGPQVASPAPRTSPPLSPLLRRSGRGVAPAEPVQELGPTASTIIAEHIDEEITSITSQPAYWAAAAVVSAVLMLWLYGSTIGSLIATWQSRPEYTHGFLVLPFAALIIWLRKSSLPTCGSLPGWGGLCLVAIALAIRLAADRLMVPSLAGWSLVIWLAGACWILAGHRCLAWALPIFIFLFFMVPLPEQVENVLSGPVQTLVTNMSSALLVCLGQPAIAEEHTLFLGERIVAVNECCSGVGIFFEMAAIAVACSITTSRSLLEKLALMGAVAPVAIFATAFRICLLALAAPGEASAEVSRGRFAWVALCIGIAMFGLFATYLRRLLVEVEVDSGRRLLNRPSVAELARVRMSEAAAPNSGEFGYESS